MMLMGAFMRLYRRSDSGAWPSEKFSLPIAAGTDVRCCSH